MQGGKGGSEIQADQCGSKRIGAVTIVSESVKWNPAGKRSRIGPTELLSFFALIEIVKMSDIDALSLSGANFFDYVREKTNDIIVDILQVQEICSTRALLCCDDPLSILEYDCDELADIKRRAVFFLKLGGHAVKNGVKGSMKYLIDKLKEIEKKHTKESKI
ncbi:unnamed protein product [Didymodactylos carnosus]|uniref:Uncharacterized protein n=1 Tax=Didymodactylos carnosus TaxID=1234261 RepID=A0A815JLX3_9BILA|nr:unnamed protein product [Didymodactylos carnosus]CAF4277005.1 unnamed protein product [Didymodactylos carnosus]